MYPNVHGVVGTISAITTYSITNDYFSSAIVAFASHDVMDRLGEKHYPTTKFLLLFEGSFILDILFFSVEKRPNFALCNRLVRRKYNGFD